MSSHQSTIVVPEDISHLHSHTSGPTNLQSIRLMLPKHPFDHDIAWVKQLQPRQHSSNKYLSFGSLGCRATARPMWISHSVLPAACSEPGRDAGAEQRCVKHSCPSLGTAAFLLPPLVDLEHRALTCVGEGGSVFFVFCFYLPVRNCDCLSHMAQDPEFSRHQWWSRFCPPDSVSSHLELLLIFQVILHLFQNFMPTLGSYSACPLLLYPKSSSGERTFHWVRVRENASWRPSNHDASLLCDKSSSFKYCF